MFYPSPLMPVWPFVALSGAAVGRQPTWGVGHQNGTGNRGQLQKTPTQNRTTGNLRVVMMADPGAESWSQIEKLFKL